GFNEPLERDRFGFFHLGLSIERGEDKTVTLWRLMDPRHPSYAWARHLDTTEVPLPHLTEIERIGLEFAERLAEDHQRCAREPPWRRDLAPLTIEEIAYDEGIAPALVRRRTAQARRALSG